MKQRAALLWVAITVFPAMLLAQTHQNVSVDPGGWTKAKWGMKEKQIKAVFPQATQVKDANGDVSLGISGYRIDPIKYTATFGFDEGGGLTSVAFDPEEEGPRHAVAEWVKMNLLEGLTDKYRKPTQVTDDKDEDGFSSTRTWQWLFPRTRITLTWVTHADPDAKHLDRTYLIYSQVRPRSGL